MSKVDFTKRDNYFTKGIEVCTSIMKGNNIFSVVLCILHEAEYIHRHA